MPPMFDDSRVGERDVFVIGPIERVEWEVGWSLGVSISQED